jgi:hypothetical protein
MRVAVLGESAADERAVRILVAGLLGVEVEPVEGPTLRSRGWPSVRASLPIVIRHLYYKTDAAGLVVVVDSDGPTVHMPMTTAPCHVECRLCSVRGATQMAMDRLSPVPGRRPLQVAVGLAVPAIEAWYAVGLDARVTEAAWIQGHQGVPPRPPYSKPALKARAYGTERPTLQHQIAGAEGHARRLLGHLDRLRQDFPGGFGSFALELEGWRHAL